MSGEADGSEKATVMARYRKIDVRIWNDEKFRALSDHGKLAFFFLMTHANMTPLGAMRHTVPGLAAELEWPAEAFREAFLEAFRKGMVEYDEKACFIALPNFLKYNPPESPNVVKAWANFLDFIPECPLQRKLIERVKAFAKALPEAFAKALPEAFAKSMPNQEQEQEQDLYTPIVPKSETCPEGDVRVSKDNPETIPALNSPSLPGMVSEEKKEKTSRRGFEYTPEFEEVWAAYPNHGAKGAGFVAYAKGSKNGMPPNVKLLTVIEKAKRSKQWTKQNGDFIPLLSTWINQHRWDDDYEPTRPPRGVVC